MSLVSHLSSKEQISVPSEIGMDQSVVDVLVAKFAEEIERLKAENGSLKMQRDNVTLFYKEEFARMWQKYEELENAKQSSNKSKKGSHHRKQASS